MTICVTLNELKTLQEMRSLGGWWQPFVKPRNWLLLLSQTRILTLHGHRDTKIDSETKGLSVFINAPWNWGWQAVCVCHTLWGHKHIMAHEWMKWRTLKCCKSLSHGDSTLSNGSPKGQSELIWDMLHLVRLPAATVKLFSFCISG